MTKPSPILVLVLGGAILGACGSAGGGVAATTRPPTPTSAPNAGTEPPKQYDYGSSRTAAPSASPDGYGY